MAQHLVQKFRLISVATKLLMFLFHVYASTMSPPSLDPDYRSIAIKDWLCEGCLVPKPGTRSIDIVIQSPLDIDNPLSFAAGGFPGIVLEEFLAPIDREVLRRHLYLGSVFATGGQKVAGYATFNARRRLTIRGTKHISERVCEVCGQMLYFAMGERHLDDLPADEETIWESDLGGLVLRNEILNKLNVERWKKNLHIERLPVYSTGHSSGGG